MKKLYEIKESNGKEKTAGRKWMEEVKELAEINQLTKDRGKRTQFWKLPTINSKIALHCKVEKLKFKYEKNSIPKGSLILNYLIFVLHCPVKCNIHLIC